MKKTLLVLLMIGASLSLFACGGSDKNDDPVDGDGTSEADGDSEQSTDTGVASCTWTGSSSGSCTEFAAAAVTNDKASLKQICDNLSGNWADSPCSHSKAVGGCKTGTGVDEQTVWYYQDDEHPDVTAETVKTGCVTGTFVEP